MSEAFRTFKDALCSARDAGLTDDAPMIWICRDVPGDHVGGPECFCCPTVVRADQPMDEIMALVSSAGALN